MPFEMSRDLRRHPLANHSAPPSSKIARNAYAVAEFSRDAVRGATATIASVGSEVIVACTCPADAATAVATSRTLIARLNERTSPRVSTPFTCVV